MKKSLLVLLAVASFVACSRDDDNSTSTIVGVWKEEKMVTYSGKDNSVLYTELPDDCEKKGSRELTKDGKSINKSFTIYQDQCIEDGYEQGKYIYDTTSKKIIIIIEGDKAEVISLTATELQLLDVSEDENNDGVKDKTIFFLKRQK